MVNAEPVEHQSCNLSPDTMVQPDVTTFGQSDGLPWNGGWSREWPHQYDTFETGLESQDYTSWSAHYLNPLNAKDHATWDGSLMDSAMGQIHLDYTTAAQNPVQDASSIDYSSPTTYYHPSPITPYENHQLSPSLHQQLSPRPGSTPSSQSLSSSNSKKSHPVMEPASGNRAKSKGRRRGSTMVPTQQDNCHQIASESGNGLEFAHKNHHKKVQERNRVAANKFRSRKRDDARKLQADEEIVEQHHRHLSSSVKELTQEVHHLKMQLLQHSTCDCVLIQNYIQNEAQRYIQGMDPKPLN